MLRYAKKVMNEPDNRKLSCFACTFMVDGVQAMIASNSTDDEIANFLVWVLSKFRKLSVSIYVSTSI